MNMINARIVVFEDGADLMRDVVTRETEAVELTAWAGTGPGRGAWEDQHPANDVRVEYTPPGRAS